MNLLDWTKNLLVGKHVLMHETDDEWMHEGFIVVK